MVKCVDVVEQLLFACLSGLWFRVNTVIARSVALRHIRNVMVILALAAKCLLWAHNLFFFLLLSLHGWHDLRKFRHNEWVVDRCLEVSRKGATTRTIRYSDGDEWRKQVCSGLCNYFANLTSIPYIFIGNIHKNPLWMFRMVCINTCAAKKRNTLWEE